MKMGIFAETQPILSEWQIFETTSKYNLWFVKKNTRWWFQIFFIFIPIMGKWSNFDEHIFQMGGEKPPTQNTIIGVSTTRNDTQFPHISRAGSPSSKGRILNRTSSIQWDGYSKSINFCVIGFWSWIIAIIIIIIIIIVVVVVVIIIIMIMITIFFFFFLFFFFFFFFCFCVFIIIRRITITNTVSSSWFLFFSSNIRLTIIITHNSLSTLSPLSLSVLLQYSDVQWLL